MANLEEKQLFITFGISTLTKLNNIENTKDKLT